MDPEAVLEDAWCELCPEQEQERLQCLDERNHNEQPSDEPVEGIPDLAVSNRQVSHLEKRQNVLCRSDGLALIRSLNHTQLSSFYQIRQWCCCEIRGRSRRHKIAFNSLYLFSLGLLSMKRMERHCIITRVERPVSRLLPGPLLLVFPRLYAQKHPGGVASMTRDRGYPDWLVLSARLLWAALQARLHWYKIYMFWLCLVCGYV